MRNNERNKVALYSHVDVFDEMLELETSRPHVIETLRVMYKDNRSIVDQPHTLELTHKVEFPSYPKVLSLLPTCPAAFLNFLKVLLLVHHRKL